MCVCVYRCINPIPLLIAGYDTCEESTDGFMPLLMILA